MSWGAVSRKGAWQKGPWGCGGCYAEREPATFPCCKDGSQWSGLPAGNHSPLVSNGEAQLDAVSFAGLLSTRGSSVKDHKDD